MTNFYRGEIPVLFTEDMIEEVISGAGFGIAYWATNLRDNGDKTITVRPAEEYVDDVDITETILLSYDQLAESLVEVASDKAGVASVYVEYAVRALSENDPGYVDSELADIVVQYAAFGTIVFG